MSSIYIKFSINFFISLWHYFSYKCPFIWRSGTGFFSFQELLLSIQQSRSLNVPFQWGGKWDMGSLVRASRVILISFPTFSISWKPFHIYGEDVYDKCIIGGNSKTLIQTTKEKLFYLMQKSKIFSLLEFLCIHLWDSHSGPVCWRSSCVLPLWVAEVNICNLKTVLIIFPRDSKVTRFCFTWPKLRCRTMVIFDCSAHARISRPFWERGQK